MEVTWDSEKFFVDLPVASLTLGSLKRYLFSRTGVPPEHMKLFCNAGLMKDDMAPLSSYHTEISHDADYSDSLRSGAFLRSGFWSGIFSGMKKSQSPPMKICMVGSKETRAIVSDRPDLKVPPGQIRPTPSVNPTDVPSTSSSGISPLVVDQPSVTAKIQELTNKVLQESLPKVEEYERRISSDRNHRTSAVDDQEDHSLATPHPQAKPMSSSNELAFLSEMLLQALLKLDGFEVESEWTEARAARKEGVRTVQGLLDRLDQIKSTKLPSSQL